MPSTVAPPAVPLPPAPPFLEVATLLDQSRPQLRPIWARYSLLFFLAILLGGAYFTSQAGRWAGTAQVISSVLMFVLVFAMFITMSVTVRGQRREQNQLETIEELIQLRRWPEAGLAVQNLLLQPTRTGWGRVQGLIYLSGILMRYHRFTDAISVQEYLLDGLPLDGSTLQSLQLGRAMAMLREDRLVDADRAISDLRRSAMRENSRQKSEQSSDVGAVEDSDSAENAAEQSSAVQPPAEATLVAHWKTARATRTHASAGLALVELYRDVKTGHPAEAIDIFIEKLPILRKQLGHRVADAHVLAARAYDLLGEAAEAARQYANATLLSPVAELHRRFPETAVLATKYKSSAAPAV